MSVETVIYDQLAADGTVSGLVGARIYPVILPQRVSYPAISYSLVSRQPVEAMGSDATLALSRLQVNAWGDTYKEAKDLAFAIRDALKRTRSAVTGVQDILMPTMLDTIDPETRIYRVMLDFMVAYDGANA